MSIFSDFISMWQSNPFLSGTMTAMVLGGLIVLLKRLPGALYIKIKRLFTTTIVIRRTEPIYYPFSSWVYEKTRIKSKSRNIMINSNYFKRGDAKEIELYYSESPKFLSLIRTSALKGDLVNVDFSPGMGSHWFFYKRRLIILTRLISKEGMNSIQAQQFQQFQPFEEYELTIFSRNRKLAISLFKEVSMYSFIKNNKSLQYIHVYTVHAWEPFYRLNRRPISSVILDDKISEKILSDMSRFFSNKEWYEKMAIPYRRGYCFYGPPGTGKSSMVIALAGELSCDIAIINLNDSSINDNTVSKIFDGAPAPIILIEDIDRCFKQTVEDIKEKKSIYSEKGSSSKSNLTFAGLLNALDGASAQEGKIVIMTTNNFDLLDPSLIRAGRCDVKVHFPKASHCQLEQLFLRFFPDSELLAKQFALKFEPRTITMAEAQRHLMEYSEDAHKAVSNANLEGDNFDIGNASLGQLRCPSDKISINSSATIS